MLCSPRFAPVLICHGYVTKLVHRLLGKKIYEAAHNWMWNCMGRHLNHIHSMNYIIICGLCEIALPSLQSIPGLAIGAVLILLLRRLVQLCWF